MSKKVAEVVVEVLASAGVKRCYGIVGDTLNAFAGSLAGGGIEWVHMRHEERARSRRQGEALLTGRLTAVGGSCGPGSLHFINGSTRRTAIALPRDPDCQPDRAQRDWLRLHPGSRLPGGLQGCSVFCETILTARAGTAQDRDGVPGGHQQERRCGLIIRRCFHGAGRDELPYAVNVNRPVVRRTTRTSMQSQGCSQKEPTSRSTPDRDARARTTRSCNSRVAQGAGGAYIARQRRHRVGQPAQHRDDGLLGTEAGYHCLLSCDTMLMLGATSRGHSSIPTMPISSRSISTPCTSGAATRYTGCGRRHWRYAAGPAAARRGA